MDCCVSRWASLPDPASAGVALFIGGSAFDFSREIMWLLLKNLKFIVSDNRICPLTKT